MALSAVQQKQIDDAVAQAPAWARDDIRNQLTQQLNDKNNATSENASNGLNPDGSPKRPDYQGILDSDGNLQDKYKLGAWSNVTPDMAAYTEMRTRALTPGSSPWAAMLLDKQARDEQNTLDQGDASAAGSAATAASRLAMQGGLSTGAAERLATQSQRDMLRTRATTLQAGMNDRTNIGLQDEQTKNSMLGQVQSADMGLANLQFQNNTAKQKTDQYNLDNALKDLQLKNQSNLQAYDEQMKKYAADQQATATQNSKDGGSWLCTEASRMSNMNIAEKRTLTRFLREAMKIDAETTRFYIQRCAPLIERMRQGGADWQANVVFVRTVIDLNRRGELIQAWKLYRNRTIALIERFWPECADPSFARIRAIRNAEIAALSGQKVEG